MKDFRLHLIVLILIVIAEKIGNISFKVGVVMISGYMEGFAVTF